jgi:hypothetical protein
VVHHHWGTIIPTNPWPRSRHEKDRQRHGHGRSGGEGRKFTFDAIDRLTQDYPPRGNIAAETEELLGRRPSRAARKTPHTPADPHTLRLLATASDSLALHALARRARVLLLAATLVVPAGALGRLLRCRLLRLGIAANRAEQGTRTRHSQCGVGWPVLSPAQRGFRQSLRVCPGDSLSLPPLI